MMSLTEKIAFILDAKSRLGRAEFARGGGGAKSAKGKAGKSSKKAKGAVQSGSGGACCKTEGGKFAPGNNYGSLNKGSAKASASRAKGVAARAAAKAEARVGASKAGGSPVAGLVARSRLAASKAAEAKATRDREQAVAAQKQARNAKARERRAARKEAATKAGPKPTSTQAEGRGTAERNTKAAGIWAGRTAIKSAVRDLAREHPNGLVPIHAIRARVAAAGGPTGPAFDAMLRKTHGRDLIAISDLRKATKDQLAQAVPGVNETLFYVNVGRSPSTKATGRNTPERNDRAELLRAQRARVAQAKAQAAERQKATQAKPASTKADRASGIKAMVAKSKATSRMGGMVKDVRNDMRKARAIERDKELHAKELERVAKAKEGRGGAMKRIKDRSRKTVDAAKRESNLRPQSIPRDAPIEVGKVTTNSGRKSVEIRRGPASLTVEQVQKGGKEYSVKTSYYDTGGKESMGGVRKVSRDIGTFDSMAKAKAHAKAQIATIGAVEPGGKPLPYKPAPKPASTKSDRAASIAKAVQKSRLASGKAGAENAWRKAAAEQARTITSKGVSIGGRAPDLRGVGPAGSTPASSRYAEGRREARDRMVRASREAAQGAKMVASKRAQAAASKPAASPERVRADKEAALAALGPRPTNRNAVQNDEPTKAWLARKAGIEVTHVPPVAPPPPAVAARPVTDPVRLQAESAAMDRAFDQAPGARDNFVPLAAVRNAMPHLSRDEFDVVLNARRDRGEVGLDSHQGETRPLSAEEKAGAVRESGSLLSWLSRRRT
jgi:hypothetical protein